MRVIVTSRPRDQRNTRDAACIRSQPPRQSRSILRYTRGTSIYISQRLAARGVGLLSNDNQYSNHCYIFTYSRVLEGPVVLGSARRACCAAPQLLKHFQKTLEALKGEPCGEGLAGVSPQLLSFDL